MIVLLQVLAVLAVVFGVAVVLTGRAEGMSEEGQDLADTGIPRDRAMTPQDVVGLRFALAFRGYRMSEVDDALDRLAAEIAARDEAIEHLRATQAAPVPVPAEPLASWGMPDMREEPEPREERAEVGPAAGAGAAGGLGAGEALAMTEEDPPVDEEPVAAEPLAAGTDAAVEEEPLAERTTVAAPVAEEPLPEAPAAPPVESPIFESTPNPFRPEVPDIPTYDPWSVTPRSRYTDGPEYVEVDEHPEDDVDVATEHHTGYAPPPPMTARDDDED